MTHLEKFFAALYASEGWYIWFSERFDKPFSRRLYGRARAVVIFDRVMNDEIVTYPKMDVV